MVKLKFINETSKWLCIHTYHSILNPSDKTRILVSQSPYPDAAQFILAKPPSTPFKFLPPLAHLAQFSPVPASNRFQLVVT